MGEEVQVGDEGLEQTSEQPGKAGVGTEREAVSEALAAAGASLDDDLRFIIEAWPDLSARDRSQVVALARGARPSGPSTRQAN